MQQSPAAAPAQPHDPQRSRGCFSLRRWRRPLAIVAAAILILASVGAFLLVRHWPFSRHQVAQSLEEDFHGRISFARFHLSYFPHPGCVAEGLTLARSSSPPGSPPLVSVERFTLHGAYTDLLLRPGYISSIVLQGLHRRGDSR